MTVPPFFRSTLTAVVCLTIGACTPAVKPATGIVKVAGESKTLKVAGEYQPVDLPQVDRMKIENNKLVLLSEGESVTVDLPPTADQPKPGQQWALITESEGTGDRDITFTHEQSLDDFTIKLPLNGAELRYGTLGGKDGNDVVVFAWGREQRSYWGYVTLTRTSQPAQQ